MGQSYARAPYCLMASRSTLLSLPYSIGFSASTETFSRILSPTGSLCKCGTRRDKITHYLQTTMNRKMTSPYVTHLQTHKHKELGMNTQAWRPHLRLETEEVLAEVRALEHRAPRALPGRAFVFDPRHL